MTTAVRAIVTILSLYGRDDGPGLAVLTWRAFPAADSSRSLPHLPRPAGKPPRAGLPRLAAVLARFAHCGPCFVGVRPARGSFQSHPPAATPLPNRFARSARSSLARRCPSTRLVTARATARPGARFIARPGEGQACRWVGLKGAGRSIPPGRNKHCSERSERSAQRAPERSSGRGLSGCSSARNPRKSTK